MDFKKILEEYNLTQAEFIRLLGIPKNTVSQWCRGLREPNDWTLTLIKFYLDHIKE